MGGGCVVAGGGEGNGKELIIEIWRLGRVAKNLMLRGDKMSAQGYDVKILSHPGLRGLIG
jgi:hypothetical protein